MKLILTILFFIAGVVLYGVAFVYWFNNDTFTHMQILKSKWVIMLFGFICLAIANAILSK